MQRFYGSVDWFEKLRKTIGSTDNQRSYFTSVLIWFWQVIMKIVFLGYSFVESNGQSV